jgi:hypothetical protein
VIKVQSSETTSMAHENAKNISEYADRWLHITNGAYESNEPPTPRFSKLAASMTHKPSSPEDTKDGLLWFARGDKWAQCNAGQTLTYERDGKTLHAYWDQQVFEVPNESEWKEDNVLRLETQEDYDAFREYYTIPIDLGGGMCLDYVYWDKLSVEYAGLLIGEKTLHNRLGHVLMSSDVETLVIWDVGRWTPFESIKKIGHTGENTVITLD